VSLHEPKDSIFLRQLNAQAVKLEKNIKKRVKDICFMRAALKANRDLAKCIDSKEKDTE